MANLGLSEKLALEQLQNYKFVFAFDKEPFDMDHGYGHEINVGYTKPISIMPIASRRLTEQKQKELKKNIDDQ